MSFSFFIIEYEKVMEWFSVLVETRAIYGDIFE